MSIFFCNDDIIDLDAIRIMGVNVKVNDSPIGHFGTGLKFAIATLLRNGQSVKLDRVGSQHLITAETKKIRGEEFEIVTLDGEALGFTTQLGRNWEVWMAYRELYSNCLDEKGTISAELPPGDWGTVIEIEGDLCEAAHAIRDTIFLSSEPIVAVGGVASLHRGGSVHGFYRGIRAHHLDHPSKFTWNLIDTCSLTEDRTLASPYHFNKAVGSLVLGLEDEELLKEILLAEPTCYEHHLNLEYSPAEPSEAFMNVCGEFRTNLMLNNSAHEIWRSKQTYNILYDPIDLNSLNEAEIDEAMALLKILDCTLTREDFVVVESLGGSFYGVFRQGFILIDKKTLEKGPRFIASTLYEEWIHKTQHLRDCTRELQNMLLDKLLFFVDLAKRSE